MYGNIFLAIYQEHLGNHIQWRICVGGGGGGGGGVRGWAASKSNNLLYSSFGFVPTIILSLQHYISTIHLELQTQVRRAS